MLCVKCDSITVGIDLGNQPTIGVILVSHRLAIQRISDLQKIVAAIVGEARHVTELISMADQVAVHIVGIVWTLPRGSVNWVIRPSLSRWKSADLPAE